MTKVSVIVPVYNTENFLERCLNSLVNQTLDDIEIIVVNDGSTDNSQTIIDDYAGKFPKKIKAYKKKNGGLSDARNFGIGKAIGKYIGFVDSDDYADLDMFKTLYEKAENGDFDVTVCDIRYVFDDKVSVVSSRVKCDLTNKNDVKEQMIDIYPAAWNKLFKYHLFDEIKFKKKVWYEDVEFLYRLLPFVSSIGVVNKPLINYVQREGAITNTFNEKIYDYVSNWNEIIDFYKERKIYDEYKDELEYCYVRYLYMTFIKTATHFDKKNYKKACKIAKENVLNHFSNYKKNKYLKGLSGFYLKHFSYFTSSLVYYFYHLIR